MAVDDICGVVQLEWLPVKQVLICIPDSDFDPTEVATPWHRLREAGFRVRFASEHGDVGACDPLLLQGVIFGQLGADTDAIERYHRMIQSVEFQNPLNWHELDAAAFDALVLPGGHAPGMKPYLESAPLRDLVLAFVRLDRPIAAICHGVLVLARTRDPQTGRSVLYGRTCTSLLATLERGAYWLTFWKLGKYYRTYSELVQDEVSRNLLQKRDFKVGKAPWIPFAVRDGRLVTARWPRDAEVFSGELIHLLTGGEV